MTEARNGEMFLPTGRQQRSVLLLFLFFSSLLLCNFQMRRTGILADLPSYLPAVEAATIINLAVCFFLFFFFFFSFLFLSFPFLPSHSSPSPHTSHPPSSNNLLLLI